MLREIALKLRKLPRKVIDMITQPAEQMCSHVFPALYLNLGTEMMYVLDQRLRVQKERLEDREKSDKVVKEIMLGFLAKKTLEEVFKGHGTPTRAGLKMFFEKVAHCSIMRLNENSMDKLFDLMMMSYKFQLMKMVMPEQIMTITVNHLRALLDLVPLDKEIGAAVEHCFTMCYHFYGNIGPNGWYMLRNSLLVFFQDTRVKVSAFIKDSRQLANGRFVLYERNKPVQLMKGTEAPGTVKYFLPNGEVSHEDTFPTTHKYTPYEDYPDTLDADRRSTDLGANPYRDGNGLMIIIGGGLGRTDRMEGNEMAMFESLMSSTVTSEVEDSDFWEMSLFDSAEDENTYAKEVAANQPIKVIDASEQKSLKETMKDLKLDKRPPTAAPGEKKKKSKGANMLDMLDEAVARPATAKKGIKAKRSESSGPPKPTKPPATDENTKPRTRSGSRPTTGARPKTGAKTEGRPEARSETRPTTKNGASRPATKSATRPTSSSRPPTSKAGERARSATPKRVGSAKKKAAAGTS